MAKIYGTDDKRSDRERYLKLKSALWTGRQSFDSHWRELADQFLPRRARFTLTDRNKGGGRNQNIYDSTGRFAVRTLQSGLHAGLTSPARPWMKLTTPDPELAAFAPVQDWLHMATQRMLSVFAQTNLYQSLPVLYGDIGVFGTGAMGVVEDTRDLFRTFTYPIGSYAIGLDARRMTTTWAHEYELTIRQVIEGFGVTSPGSKDIDRSRFSNSVLRQWDKGDYENSVAVCWIVQPNMDRRTDRLEARYSMPWVSYHFESAGDSKTMLRESGYHEFPVMVPRWDVTGEDAYGTDCPGMTALPDSKMLQSMQRHKGRAIAKMIDPPLVGPTSLLHQVTSLLPAAITHADVRDGMQGLKPIHEVRVSIQELGVDIGQTQYRLSRAFYEDLFLMLAQADQMGSAQKTAREIEERHEEKLLALGPVLERANDELFDPLVDRVFGMMMRAHLLPDPPEELNGVNLKVEYTSIMAQAQKLVGVVGQDRLLQTVIPILELDPDSRHKVDFSRFIDNYREMLSTDPALIRSNEEAAELVEQDRQARQTAATAANAAAMGKAAKDAAAAPLDGDTALSRVMAVGGIQ